MHDWHEEAQNNGIIDKRVILTVIKVRDEKWEIRIARDQVPIRNALSRSDYC
jgi:hypothetical protein